MSTLPPSLSPDHRFTPRSPTAHPIAAAAPPKPTSRLELYALLGTCLLIAAFFVGWLPRRNQRAAVAQSTRELAIPTVTLVSPGPGVVGSAIVLPAEIRAVVESPIYARATGYIRRWNVDLGASVTNGQVLAELETPELNQDFANAQAQARQAAAAAALAKTTAVRWTQLLESRLVSQQETDEKLADARYKEAAAEGAQANAQRLETLTGFAGIRAPFAGIITARRVDVGQLVTAGNGAELFHLAQTQTLRVYVRVPQTLATTITVGQPGEVLLNEYPNRTFPARVVHTAGSLDAASRTLLVELELPNPQSLLLPGGFAQVRFPEARVDVPLTIPANTLLFRPTGPQVGVVDANSGVELRNVTLGRDFGATVEITGGLTVQDRLILNPGDSLTAGMHVRQAEAAPARQP